jgi:hypothetical protein
VKRTVRTWDRPELGKKAIARTSNGAYQVDGTSGIWTRLRGSAELLARALQAEFKRCGWPTAKVKVIEVRSLLLAPNERGVFYLNLGFLRGLDPDAVYAALKALPDKCGHRALLERIGKLPERVEIAVPVSEVVG